jgi:hypothetical protein
MSNVETRPRKLTIDNYFFTVNRPPATGLFTWHIFPSWFRGNEGLTAYQDYLPGTYFGRNPVE